MFKSSALSIFILAIFIREFESNNLFNFLDYNGCPEYSSQENLDLNKLAGVWYGLATNAGDQSCSKTVVSLNSNGTVQMDSSEFINGTERNMQALFTTDPNKPGELFLSFPVVDLYLFTGEFIRSVNAQSSVVFTDYDNIAVFFTCFDTLNNFVPSANRIIDIVVRNRSFDSLTLFGKAIAPLLKLGSDLNDIDFTYNGDECKN